jgi:hypothetical protein
MMDIRKEVLNLMERLATQKGVQAIPPGTGEVEIREFEARTGLSVPLAFREWLKVTNGARLGDGVFGIGTEAYLDIEETLRLYPQWLGKGYIPIAGDGCGNFYVIDSGNRQPPQCPVLFIDTISDPESPAYAAASDPWHFLYFYFARHLGETSWPFDKHAVLRIDPFLVEVTSAPRPWEAE